MSTEQSFTSDTGKRAHASNELFTIDFSPYMGRMNAPVLVPQEIVEKVRSAVKTHLSADGELLNLYVWGSRFYMNHSTRSDYDLVAIVTGMAWNRTPNLFDTNRQIFQTWRKRHRL